MSAQDTNVNPPEGDWEGTNPGSGANEEAVEEAAEGGAFEKDPASLSDLKSLRKLIDQKNKSIVRLLNRRAGYALRIAEVKKAEGLAIRDDEREKEVLKKVSRYNKGPLSDEALHRIFMCIMEEHRKLEGEALSENQGEQP
ncbi:MAG: chorismate mutase [Fibrobacteria bacterium]|jgi:chorismate mutase|nr:chorismate mutase [Fibrobacteria bacterium]